MAGVPAASSSSNLANYGTNNLTNPITSLPANLLQGTGVAGLTAPAYTAQTFTPTDVTSQYNEQQGLQQAIQDLSNNYYGPNNNKVNSLSADFNAGTNLASLYSMLTAAKGNPYGGQSSQINTDLNTILNDLGGGNASQYSIGNANSLLNTLGNTVGSEQNSNLAGYNATNAANGQEVANVQQAAIAQNQLLAELNQRGLLQSYINGGMGTADMQSLQNSLNEQGVAGEQGLQSALSGLQNGEQNYLMGQQTLQNNLGNFNQQKANAQPGLTDILGLGASSLPLLL
jgi:hypothetical protein